MGRKKRILFFACLLAGFAIVPASGMDVSEAAPADAVAPAGSAAGVAPGLQASKWDSEAEAGIVSTTGNAETQSINTRFKIENERERWRHRLNAEYLKASDKGGTTAERSAIAFKSDFSLSGRSYLFGSVRCEGDVFSGYHSQIVDTAGYGYRFAFSDASRLETEAGAGSRHTRFVGGTRSREGILRLAAKFTQLVGDANEFREEVLTEMAGANTRTESITSLKTKINGKLSMKLAFTATHNTDVLPGIRKTDTVTSVTLVYDLL